MNSNVLCFILVAMVTLLVAEGALDTETDEVLVLDAMSSAGSGKETRPPPRADASKSTEAAKADTSKPDEKASQPTETDEMGCPTMEEAYAKFKGDMQRIEGLMEQAQKRANDAETKAQQETEAASKCLSAQKLLNGSPEADQSAEMQKEVQRQVAKVKAQHKLEIKKMSAEWENKLNDAVQAEKDRQEQHMEGQLKAVRLGASTDMQRMKQKYTNLEADTAAMKATTQLRMTRLETDLQETQGKAMTGLAGARRAREADASGASKLRTINKNNLDAVRLLKTQLEAKTAEAESCATACATPKSTFADDPDQPCPTRMTHLLDQVAEIKQSNAKFQEEAMRKDQRLVRTRVQLKATREHISELQKQMEEHEGSAAKAVIKPKQTGAAQGKPKVTPKVVEVVKPA